MSQVKDDKTFSLHQDRVICIEPFLEIRLAVKLIEIGDEKVLLVGGQLSKGFIDILDID